MALSKDWREFLELLSSRGVDYVIVGAQSAGFHARPHSRLNSDASSRDDNSRGSRPHDGQQPRSARTAQMRDS